MASILKSRHVRRNLWVLLLGVLCILSVAPAGFAQQAEIDHLASQVAQGIATAGKRKVAVADFVAVNGKSVPLGTWLADQFSAALAKTEPSLEIINRAKVKAALEGEPPIASDPRRLVTKEAGHLCDAVSAEILVTASLGPAEKAVGVTFHSLDCLERGYPHAAWSPAVNGKIPLSPEIEALLPEPLESPLLPGGVWKSGEGGAGEPSCVLCPSPGFSDEAVKKNKSGVVIMGVTVTVDGQAADIKLLKSVGYGLDEKAMEAVLGWKFKPALGPEGTPVAVRTIVEVTFKLLQRKK